MSATEEQGACFDGRLAAKPHAVVVPWPGQGHINPLLHLSKILASQGFSITFVNLQYTHSRVMSSIHRQELEETQRGKGLPPLAKLDIRFVCIPDGIPADTPTGDVPELCRGVIRSSSAFEHLLHELHPPPTCIISDTFVLHSQDAANKFGIPRVSFWTQSVATYAVYQILARGSILWPSGACLCHHLSVSVRLCLSLCLLSLYRL
ncbi:hypothetical protein L7F22_055877 [Adiantum nelumboides]|nr:hypothetical protein [Adiantum nelumboides]